jgi:hypothetical protein
MKNCTVIHQGTAKNPSIFRSKCEQSLFSEFKIRPKERTQRVCEDRMLRIMFLPKRKEISGGWGDLHN